MNPSCIPHHARCLLRTKRCLQGFGLRCSPAKPSHGLAALGAPREGQAVFQRCSELAPLADVCYPEERTASISAGVTRKPQGIRALCLILQWVVPTHREQPFLCWRACPVSPELLLRFAVRVGGKAPLVIGKSWGGCGAEPPCESHIAPVGVRQWKNCCGWT